MAERPGRLFLEHRSYRRRRLIDAVRLLPVAGAVLILAPALLADPDRGGGLAWRGLYFFGVWIVLIMGTVILNRLLSRHDDGPDPETRGDRAGLSDAPEAAPAASVSDKDCV